MHSQYVVGVWASRAAVGTEVKVSRSCFATEKVTHILFDVSSITSELRVAPTATVQRAKGKEVASISLQGQWSLWMMPGLDKLNALAIRNSRARGRGGRASCLDSLNAALQFRGLLASGQEP